VAAVPHVRGRFTLREVDPETGTAEPQKWEAVCEQCGVRFQGLCESGQVRRHIQRFSVLHLHRDPLAAPRVRR
jgi:hypothetical protein